jgi:hypothetical protein
LKAAFIDTSAVAAILFEEAGWRELHQLLSEVGPLYASNLLEAELRSAAARENVDQKDVDEALSRLEWVLPERPLSQELRAVASCGTPLKGADSWHLACALFLAGDPSVLPFLTLDGDQALGAGRLGFKVIPGTSKPTPGAQETQAVYNAGKPISKRLKKKLPKTNFLTSKTRR